MARKKPNYRDKKLARNAIDERDWAQSDEEDEWGPEAEEEVVINWYLSGGWYYEEAKDALPV